MNHNSLKEEAGAATVCGMVLVDKPAGKSSHDMVAELRRLSGHKKIGHAGTLDPFATGLLLLLAGKATRLFDFLASLEKQYLATIQFGAKSNTGDSQGEIAKIPGDKVTKPDLMRVLPHFTGFIKQVPPAFSAVKVNGERLYRKARRGEQVCAAPRQVFIKSIDIERFDESSQQADLLVRCAKGTYVRALCEDIAGALGTHAYAAALRRTAIGRFTVSQAVDIRQLAAIERRKLLSDGNPAFISCFGALYFLPVREVSEKEARDVAQGRPLTRAMQPLAVAGVGPAGPARRQPLTWPQAKTEAAGPVRITRGGRLLAVYEPVQENSLKPMVVLR